MNCYDSQNSGRFKNKTKTIPPIHLNFWWIIKIVFNNDISTVSNSIFCFNQECRLFFPKHFRIKHWCVLTSIIFVWIKENISTCLVCPFLQLFQFLSNQQFLSIVPLLHSSHCKSTTSLIALSSCCISLVLIPSIYEHLHHCVSSLLLHSPNHL